MLQSVFSVFIVYRHKTLTGSPDPMHANCMDTPCIASTSKESESIEMAKGQFSEEHFTPILSSDEEDYDDYTDKDVEEFPELDYIDEQLHEAMSKLTLPKVSLNFARTWPRVDPTSTAIALTQIFFLLSVESQELVSPKREE